MRELFDLNTRNTRSGQSSCKQKLRRQKFSAGKKPQENLSPKTYTQIFICGPWANVCRCIGWKMKFLYRHLDEGFIFHAKYMNNSFLRNPFKWKHYACCFEQKNISQTWYSYCIEKKCNGYCVFIKQNVIQFAYRFE